MWLNQPTPLIKNCCQQLQNNYLSSNQRLQNYKQRIAHSILRFIDNSTINQKTNFSFMH